MFMGLIPIAGQVYIPFCFLEREKSGKNLKCSEDQTYFFNLFNFYWRIIALQYWLLSAVHEYESAIGILMSPLC